MPWNASALCFPAFPGSCGQTFTEAKDREPGLLGVRAVAFSGIPPHLGLLSLHTDDWDPFLAACDHLAGA